jgi:hypothetical protein
MLNNCKKFKNELNGWNNPEKEMQKVMQKWGWDRSHDLFVAITDLAIPPLVVLGMFLYYST